MARRQGCSPLGPWHEVTAAEQNPIMELDGKRALDVLMDQMEVDDLESFGRLARDVHVAVPVHGADTGDYMVRNLLGIDPDNGILAIGEWLQPGDTLMFCQRDADTAWQDLQRMLDAIRKAVPGVPKPGLTKFI